MSFSALHRKDLKEIQSGPVVSFPTTFKLFFFFRIVNTAHFSHALKGIVPSITSSEESCATRDKIAKRRAEGNTELLDITALNLAFSHTGLEKYEFALPGNLGDVPFANGQLKNARSLKDRLDDWKEEFRSTIDGLFVITGNPEQGVRDALTKIKADLGDSVESVFEHLAQTRPGEFHHKEHFGYADGISQPYVHFYNDAEKDRKPLPGQLEVNPGVLLVGQPGDPVINPPNSRPAGTRPEWALNGSFLVYRHLQQKVPEWNKMIKDAATALIPIPTAGGKDVADMEALIGARLIGRWKSGKPVVLPPFVDDATVGEDPQVNNDFDYPKDQVACPFVAHTRKTRPRGDIDAPPGRQHAIMRGGITFGPEVTPEEESTGTTTQERGLSFVSYQSSISDGFEFIQKLWCNNPNFPPNPQKLTKGPDPVVGQNNGGTRTIIGFAQGDPSEPLTLNEDFVVTQGGEYFFLPSIHTLKVIAGLHTHHYH
ncbi:Dyp-type peroxidase [Serendipita vermifera]|nr:Dyp-type peroxidase [Serendipita vermifera]